MKKTFKFSVLLATIAMSLGFSSCKKEWSCECTDKATGAKETFSLAAYGKIKKSQAELLCNVDDADEKCVVK